MQEFVVTRQEAGGRFDKYLKKRLPLASSGFVYKMLRKKNITLNDKKAEGRELLTEGDVVKLFFSGETYQKFSGSLPVREDKAPGVFLTASALAAECGRAYREIDGIFSVYEDEDILILNKPAGVLSQKARASDISANEWMLGYLLEKKEITGDGLLHFRPSVCNRLDRNTSGLLLCGKTPGGSRFLSKLLKERGLHKYYLGYVKGKIEEPLTLRGYLKKEETKNRSDILSEDAYRRKIKVNRKIEKVYKKVETVVRPETYFDRIDYTKAEILLVTGKSHQIRAQLASIGHPLLGDIKYGWKPQRKEEESFRCQMLHARRVVFPETEGEFSYLSGKCVTAPAPPYFAKWEKAAEGK